MTLQGQFRKFDHLERLGHPEVADIDYGLIHVFPKLDGTNASVWLGADGLVRAGSRNRVLSLESDNAGFCAWVMHDECEVAERLRAFLQENPTMTVYGEWLVPHTLKTYEETAWRKFWIFDVFCHEKGGYLHYDSFAEALKDGYSQHVIPPLCTMENPSKAQLDAAVAANVFLIQDGAGAGEGIVLKNYEWQNKFGRQPWAKLVRNEFKASNREVFGTPHIAGAKQVEAEIVADVLTTEFIRKEFAKVVTLVADDMGLTLYTGDEEPEVDGPSFAQYDAFVATTRGKIIPRFLGTFWLTFVEEEMRGIVKKFKNPVVDFGKLQKLAVIKAKQTLTEVF